MRRPIVLSATFSIAVALSSWACSQESVLDCASANTCSHGNDGGATDGGGDVIAPPGCDLAVGPKDSPACIDDAVAIFVSPSGDDAAAGSKSLPVKSIAKGIELAGARGLPRVYVCEGTYDANVEIKSPVSVFGGLACTWAPSEVKPKLAPPKGVALRVTKVSGAVAIADMEIIGSADPNTPGDSAIAVFVSESTDVTFRNDAISAGPGTAGAKGESRSNYAGATATSGGNASGATAGTGPTCTCTDNTSSTGGNGAAGNGGDIAQGSSNPALASPVANAGSSSVATCTDGQPGGNGAAGASASGSNSPGTLGAGGWESVGKGVAAENGKPAQGGGGGGAKTGASNAGGGGACGGCGGAGGTVGASGGGSFALLSFHSSVTIEEGLLSSSAGGVGGAGGTGQDGQSGGALGIGACNGGPGGHGAGGSGGGGGAGGHSVPIAFVGTEPRVTGATLTPGTAGAGGEGGQPGAGPGNPGAAGAKGTDGKSQNTLAL